MMRILVTYEYPFGPHSYAGGNQATRGLSKALARLGHEVHVACTGTDELGVAVMDAAVTYHFTGSYHKRTTGIDTSRLGMRLMRKMRPDLLICMTSEAAALVPFARARRTRSLVYIGTPKLPPFGRRLSVSMLRHIRVAFGSYLQFLASLAANRVVTVSHSLAAEARHQWGLREDRVACIGLGMDEAILATPATDPSPFTHAGPRLVSVGRIVHAQKPLDVMASGLAAVTRSWSVWTIVGAGSDERDLRAHISALGLEDRVRFLGTQLPERVRMELDQAHIVLLPSRYEGYFTTVYEAVSRGRVVVTNDVNDVVRSFGGVDSVLVADRAESGSFRVLIERAIDNFDDLSQHALDASEVVRSTETWDKVAVRLLAAADRGSQ